MNEDGVPAKEALLVRLDEICRHYDTEMQSAAVDFAREPDNHERRQKAETSVAVSTAINVALEHVKGHINKYWPTEATATSNT